MLAPSKSVERKFSGERNHKIIELRRKNMEKSAFIFLLYVGKSGKMIKTWGSNSLLFFRKVV